MAIMGIDYDRLGIPMKFRDVTHSGWWFGTVGSVIIPADFNIFQRGRAQPPTSISQSSS